MTPADANSADAFAPVIVCGLTEAELAAYRSVFDLFELAMDAGGGLALRHAGARAELAFAPRNALALVVAVPSLADPVADWALAGGLDAPIITHAPELPALLAAMARRLHRAARMAGEVTRRLAALRAAHENLQNAYEGLRAHVQERGSLLPALGFFALPDRDGSRLPPGVAELTQYIPCDFRSLCGIALHLAEPAPAGAHGVLDLHLSSPENPALRVDWSVGYEQLRPGWTSFVFDGLAPALRSSAVLRLRFRTLAGAAPVFSLGRPHVRADRTAVADGVALARPLAFRAWTNIPGAPLTLTASQWPAIRPAAAKPAMPRIEVLAGDDFVVEDVRGLGARLDFQPVRKLPRQRRILIHPLGPLPSVGRIPLCCPAGTRAVRAEVETDHADAHDLEYGIALDATALTDAAGQPTGDFSFDARSDWLVVPAKTPGTLLIELAEPLAAASDLYLVCRCPPGSSSDWGWAHVTRLTVAGDFGADAVPGGPLMAADAAE